MNQLYHIKGFCAAAGNPDWLSYGFNVQLWPAWKEAVTTYGWPTEPNWTCKLVERLGTSWLTDCGFDPQIYDPPRHAIRITWGEWGPEHITVPGNACGLDLATGLWAPPGGRVLLPHNVDSRAQATLLLTVFLFFADTLVMDQVGRRDPAAG